MSNRKLALEAEMVKRGVTRGDLVKLLGITYQAVHAKITGKSEFKCQEMFDIQERLNTDMTLDELFK